jgi:hypothetical protein
MWLGLFGELQHENECNVMPAVWSYLSRQKATIKQKWNLHLLVVQGTIVFIPLLTT